MASKGAAAAAAGIGVLFVWAGLNGKSILNTVKATVQGQSAAGTPAVNPITGSTAAGAGGSGTLADESAISADALQYAGAGYVWGGAPAQGAGHWDCSSFCNWVCGHDLGLPIPTYAAGTYTGASHGPVTGEWLLWGGLQGVSSNPADAQPGDLCVWQTHMGIALGGGQMISALNTADGTKVTTIQEGAPGGELLYIRRYPSSPASQPGAGMVIGAGVPSG